MTETRLRLLEAEFRNISERENYNGSNEYSSKGGPE
jgi:hypothetical protein